MDDAAVGGQTAERHGSTGAHSHGGESAEPDVLLDVSQLRVEEISLDVEELRAHVSVEADMLSLLNLSIGVDAQRAASTSRSRAWKPRCCSRSGWTRSQRSSTGC